MERRAADDLLVVRLRAATLKLATARLLHLLRKANFDPSQPRVPRGEAGGGRWTDGGGTQAPRRSTGEPVRVAQARGGRGRATPMLRLPGGVVELSPAQAIRYEAARIRAENEVARFRAVPGNENWKPPAGLYSTVEGAIRQQDAIADAALAYRYGRIGHNSGSVEPLRSGDTQRFTPGTIQTFAPNGVLLGSRHGRAGPEIYTLDQSAFDDLLTNVLRGSRLTAAMPASYADKGYWIELADRCIVGLRWSKDNGATIEVISSSDKNLVDNKTKFHRGEK